MGRRKWVSDLPHGHGLWSSGCMGWMAKGSDPMALAVLSPDLALQPTCLALPPYLTIARLE
jgi:hypothetical protein